MWWKSWDWDQIVSDVGPRLFEYYRMRGAGDQASDLTQETLIRLVHKVENGEYKSSQGSLISYSYGIARYVWLENKRQIQNDLPIEDALHVVEDEQHRPDSILQNKKEYRRFQSACQTLSEQQREVLGLFLDEELSIQEIAKILDMPTGTIKSHLHRAKELLKFELNNE